MEKPDGCNEDEQNQQRPCETEPTLDLSEPHAAPQREPQRGVAVVVLPEIVPARWWHNLLHNQTALLLKAVLLYRRSRSPEARVIIDVPYRLRR
jgi:hypothetical protein